MAGRSALSGQTVRGHGDYHLTVEVRNANLIRAAKRRGCSSLRELADASGMPKRYSNIVGLVNMTYSPFDKSGRVREWVDELCFFLETPFSELFNERQQEGFKNTRVQAEIGDAEVKYFLETELPRLEHNPVEEATQAQMKEKLHWAISTLSPREQRVLKGRFFEGLGYEELGKQLDVPKHHIRKIEAKAILKLKHPCRPEHLRSFLDE